MKYQYFIGIDMSKNTFHCSVEKEYKTINSLELTNDSKGLKQLEQILKDLDPAIQQQALLCVEHTGIYNYHLLQWAHEKGYDLWLENPLAIKKSLGIQRGKNDRIDAKRIGQYAARFTDRARLWSPTKETLVELKNSLALRERLLSAFKQLKNPLSESCLFSKASGQQRLEKVCQPGLDGLSRAIVEVEKHIDALVCSDENLSHLQKIVQSVDGIGRITALELITASNEFKKIASSRSCACYAGVAPFAYSSGSSINRRARVSHLADKRLKSLLHMSAMSVIRVKGELQDYYQRKVGEGKSKMSVLNAVRNKLLSRVYACVADNRLYSKNYAKLSLRGSSIR